MSIILVYCLHFLVVISYLTAAWVSTRFFWVAIALHAGALYSVIPANGVIDLGQLISLFLLCTMLVAWKGLTVKFSQKLLVALTIFATIIPLLLNDKNTIPLYSLHVLLALFAYISATASFFYWLDIVVSEKLFKNQPQLLPETPLLLREKRCILFVTAAFCLLTLTLASGFFNAYTNNLPIFDITHKNIFAVLTWLTFAILLTGRYFFGWRGQRALIYYFIGCVFLILSYIISTFILYVIN